MTIAEWSKRTDFVELWKKTWEQPHMKAGMDVLVHLGIPVTSLIQPAQGEAMELRALAHSRTEGWFAAVKAIDLLKNPAGSQGDLPAPWEEPTT